MAVIINNLSNRVEESERMEVLNDFKDKVINYLRDEQLNLNGFKILYNSEDINGIINSVLRATIINECENPKFDEEELMF